MPWFSIPMLSANPVLLFALLHCRTQHAPHEWAAFDFKKIEAAFDGGRLSAFYSPECVDMRGEQYGHVVEFNHAAAYQLDIVGLPRALLVLEAQALLMSTLENITNAIVEGLGASGHAGGTMWKDMAKNGAFGTLEDNTSWSSYTYQAFCRPPRFEASRLHSLAQAQLDAAGDHLWALQCDAPYMRSYLKDHLRPYLSRPLTIDRAEILGFHTGQALTTYRTWRWIESQISHVKAIKEECAHGILPAGLLSHRLAVALDELHWLLLERHAYWEQVLAHLLQLGPATCTRWAAVQASIGLPPGASTFDYRSVNTNFRSEDPLFWFLFHLTMKSRLPRGFDHAAVLSSLDQHIENHHQDRKALEEPVYQAISNMAIFSEMITAIQLKRPQVTLRRLQDGRSRNERSPWNLRTLDFGFPMAPAEERGEPVRALLDGFYKQEAPRGTRDRTWLARRRAQASALEGF